MQAGRLRSAVRDGEPDEQVVGPSLGVLGGHVPVPVPVERVGVGDLELGVVPGAATGLDSVFGKVLSEEAERLRESRDTYVFHEHLESENHPVYFHEFAERCRECGLQYLGA